jgi:hypothetical protein
VRARSHGRSFLDDRARRNRRLPTATSWREVKQQIFVILPDRLRQYAFHMMAYGNGQCETLRVESVCRTRNINDAQEFAVGRS